MANSKAVKKPPRPTPISFIQRAITWLVLLAHLLTTIPATAAESLKPAVSGSNQPIAHVDTAQAATYLIASTFNSAINLQVGQGARSISSAGSNVAIQASGALNLSQALVQATQDVTTTGGAGSSTAGAKLLAGRDLSVTTTDRLNFTSGGASFQAGRDLTVVAQGITTANSAIVARNISLNAGTTNLDNTRGNVHVLSAYLPPLSTFHQQLFSSINLAISALQILQRCDPMTFPDFLLPPF